MNQTDAQRGATLLYVILLMLALSGFSYALVGMNSSSVMSELLYDRNQRAYYLALSGINYAESYKGADLIDLDGEDFAVNSSGSDSFSLQVQQTPELTYLIQATGVANSGQSTEARVTLHKEVSTLAANAISFKYDFDKFKMITSESSKTPIKINTDKKNFSIGANQKNAFGAMYYAGTKDLPANSCSEGACDFKLGMRVFYTFHFDKTTEDLADGFNFIIFNTTNNKLSSIGGDSAMGEMLGYAGDSRVYAGDKGAYGDGTIIKWVDPDRKGISPPKIAVEFDPFTNAGTAVCPTVPIITGKDQELYELTKTHTSDDNRPRKNDWDKYWKITTCTDAKPITWKNNTIYTHPGAINSVSSTRADPTKSGYTHFPHVAFMFWGDDNEDMTCKYRYGTCIPNTNGYLFKKTGTSNSTKETEFTATDKGMQTYDDNKHGLGNNSGNASGDYFPATGEYDWKSGKSFAFRYEVKRGQSSETSGINSGKYRYELAFWIKPCIYTDCSDQLKTRFSDTSRNYKVPADDPNLKKIVYLSADENTKLNRVYFGYTEATGGSTQNATIEQLILQFIKEGDKDITSLN